MSFMDQSSLEILTRRIRSDILTMTTTAGSGHPTSSLSAVELMTTLFFNHLRYDLSDPAHAANDRVIFSKGHASPLYYALYAAAGVISQEELSKYRTFDSILEGHPTERFKYTEAATGSLGQGLSIGLGEALAINLMKSPGRVFVLAGDGEIAEGSVWEAAGAASHKNIDNLFLVVDVNGLGQSDPTMYQHEGTAVYAKRFEAFGWHVVVVDEGNDLSAVDRAWQQAFAQKGKPTVVLAKTKKGAGISFLADASGWHGKPLSKDELPKALAELGEVDTSFIGTVLPPSGETSTNIGSKTKASAPTYDPAKPVATRKAFGNALLRLGAVDPSLVVIDGDVKNSTYTEFFGKAIPDRFVELFIAEQNMVGVAVGFSARAYHPVVASFACFLSRAADQIRMAAFSGANILVNGSHAGVSIGEDGPSQMGLEDLALFRSVHRSTVFYPSDAFSTEVLTELALQQKGIVYVRTSRPETPILYDANESFVLGGSKTHTSKEKEVITVVAAGVTLHEALKAQEELEKEQIGIRVIDAYSVKPIDEQTLKQAAAETQAIVVVEDHYPEGGLGEAVKTALAGDPRVPIIHLAVYKTPRSGKAAQLLDYEGIAAGDIVETVHSFLSLRGV
jgi:transketolase